MESSTAFILLAVPLGLLAYFAFGVGLAFGLKYVICRLQKQELQRWTLPIRLGWHILAFSVLTLCVFPGKGMELACCVASGLTGILWLLGFSLYMRKQP
jgi:hypothetical protein